ncbi:unnamed protein product [Arctia plantaginis]|uniref:AIMP2 thioredoxin-like domain-containing protein n=1 Tax=Arctia plantaginis TaxID=874455 RepID=A0A8S1ABL8_ARCPL|nr:unnamed protein product [Arctia plantaginis]CAB3242124.1 unnamed protein product [Arctia plantaginis]
MIRSVGSNIMTELEHRQDQLLQKLDTLYDRIKSISSHCNIEEIKTSSNLLPTPEEAVLVVSPDSLPWYLNIILKETSIPVNISWHIHSSVPTDKVAKIKNFVKNLQMSNSGPKINIRLIFKCVSADTELKLSSLMVPVIGNVNILRYLSFVYPGIILYDSNDHQMDYLLDVCHLLERTTEKNKEALFNKLSSQCKEWMYGNHFSIIDLATYNALKQFTTIPKYVNKPWFDKCEKLCS